MTGAVAGGEGVAPVEVVVDRLILNGVQEGDASAVVAAFRRHLAAMLVDPATPGARVTRASGARAGQPPQAESETERLGRELAAAVARAALR